MKERKAFVLVTNADEIIATDPFGVYIPNRVENFDFFDSKEQAEKLKKIYEDQLKIELKVRGVTITLDEE